MAAIVLALSGSFAEAAEPVCAKRAVILDTDIGDDVDDAFALALVLASPELELRGVTTVFKDAHSRALIACHMLEQMGRADVPVASGAPGQATPEKQKQFQYAFEPPFAKRPVNESAVEFLYAQLKAHPGELTLLPIGPLTNIATLLEKHPDCKPWIKEIVLMGGSVRVGYKEKSPPDVEWNIRCDIKAAQQVFSAGVPLFVAPLDATAQLKLDEAMRQRIFKSGAPAAGPLETLYRLWGNPTPILFDPVAVSLCYTDKFSKIESLRLQVDDQGFTREVAGQPNARVATSIDGDAFLKWYVDRIAAASAAKP